MADWHHGGLEPTSLHERRLNAVVAALVGNGVRSVLDLGCGSGLVVERLLAVPGIERIVGLDPSPIALAQARERFGHDHPGVELRQAGLGELHLLADRFDAATLVEVIEHLPATNLSRLEQALFVHLRPARVVVTTPNAEWNDLLGLPPGRLRHPDHCFEWPRARFRGWARALATRRGYRVRFVDIGDWHPDLGAPSQMASFTIAEPAAPVAE